MHCLFFTSLLGFIVLSTSEESSSEESTSEESTSEEFSYNIESVIKRGGHGTVFKGRSEFDSKQCVAIKAEESKTSHKLYNEYLIYRDLKDGKGIPKTFWFGVADLNYTKEEKIQSNVLVMELLGPDIESLFCKQGGHFSLKTVLMLAEQFLNRVEYLHKKNYVHRDLKPHNFLMGTGESGTTVYLADFGVTKRYNPTM